MSKQVVSIKLVMVGDGTVGKTCILFSYTKNEFPHEYVPTIFDNSTTTIKINNSIINLGLWDTAGQQEYARLRPLAYPGSDIFFIVFSVMQQSTLTNAIKRWYPEVQKTVPDALIAIVGNKIDLRKGQKGYVESKDAKQQLKGLNCLYYEVSALTKQGLTDLFEGSVKEVLKRKEKKKQQISEPKQHNEVPICGDCQLI